MIFDTAAVLLGLFLLPVAALSVSVAVVEVPPAVVVEADVRCACDMLGKELFSPNTRNEARFEMPCLQIISRASNSLL